MESTSARWWFSQCVITVILLAFISISFADARTRTISLFSYCGAHILVDEHDLYTVQLYGNLFPVTMRSCQVKFASTDIEDKLMYRVTRSYIYKINEEIAVDSSKDGKTYNSQEFITTTSPPKELDKERRGERFLNVSAFRTSGYIQSTFSIVIQIYGEEYQSLDDSQTFGFISGSIILGIVLSIGFIVIVIIVIAMYVKKNKIARNLQSNRRTTSSHPGIAQNQNPTEGTAMTYFGGSHQQNQPAPFLPQYPPASVGNGSVFTVNPQTELSPAPLYSTMPNELPPSYDEAMKTGLREVTL